MPDSLLPRDVSIDPRRFNAALPLPRNALVGFLIAALVVVTIGIISYISLRLRDQTRERVDHAVQVLDSLQQIRGDITSAETSQRGYLMTGEADYLEPYRATASQLGPELDSLVAFVADDPEQADRARPLQQLVSEKLAELERTIQLRQNSQIEEAITLVRTNEGRLLTQRILTLLADMTQAEQILLRGRQDDWRRASNFSVAVTLGGVIALLLLIAAGAGTASRDYRTREIQAWLRTGTVRFNERIQGERRIEILAGEVLQFLVDYLRAQIGAVYVLETSGQLRRVASFAGPPGQPETLRIGEGLLGEAARARGVMHVQDIPPDHLPLTSSSGRSEPRELLLCPANVDGELCAVVELGFLREVGQPEQLLLARVAESLAVAVRSAANRSRLEELLEETQRQSEELQSQQEELRVSNEELEVHARSLKESQARLESQQAELEQNNAQLEEHTQLLQKQRDHLAETQSALAEKASELQRINQYKSEFLANMSHELRTPLNSTLILAKLLADNKAGNLSAEQVKFAQTISSAGNDLLALINDVLDLSKIEAGKVEVAIERVAVGRILDSLQQAFRPLAGEKHLAFAIEKLPAAPAEMRSDAQRLAQILRNLLSNAFKFTAHGGVTLRVGADGAGNVTFAVKDSGIGIEPHQHGVIFEAFRQADGSTHRRFGGTGLGLSISRDLARLLGGDILVTSEPGKGSTFTLTLPIAGPAPAQDAATTARVAVGWVAETSAARPASPEPHATHQDVVALPTAQIEDDREHWEAGSRGILVVEDDVRFAAILRDLAREMGFQCIVTHNAANALAAIALYPPKAILLDVQLPDQSGLGVLEQLKRDPVTRHIPVHVASVSDFAHEALELGAVGYALKPVRREQLVEAFQRLESKFAQSLRRVLIVEDNAQQRESIRLLLESDDVHITGVSSAEEALEKLRATTFDCMVIDLNLPDLSGFELLEKMAEGDAVSFPPVIIYTGRSLTRAEEQELRRFSRSIIIKDARSPERLLDEVTLFLHQVEANLPADRQRMLKEARHRESRFEGRRILVVEDDIRNIFALTSLLEPKGAFVELARNGREALDLLERSGEDRFDLVLMDIMMPEMDGLTAMREIRKNPLWKRLPIIALTAKAMDDDRERSLAAGANDYIAKPLDVERLMSLIRVWMK